ncbi:signal peptidase I [Candidatus Woesebacteria bacterium]|nr:signal peptidase I [Candidatus Woesebacteria bacterium]
MLKFFRFILSIFQVIGSLALTVFVSVILLQYASQQTIVPMKFKTFVVQSGSMEPTIMTGDMVFIRPAKSYGKDDVVTYNSPEKHVVTHRIIDTKKTPEGQIEFQTKGDNNHAQDPYTIAGSAILGKWWFTVPKLGYIQVYARSKMGMIVIFSVLLGWILSDFTWQQLSKKQQLKSN